MRLRDLRVSKQYRDTVEKWGEPNVIRKRTIIAPPMRDAIEKDVRLRPSTEYKEQSKSEGWNTNVSKQIESLFADLGIDSKYKLSDLHLHLRDNQQNLIGG